MDSIPCKRCYLHYSSYCIGCRYVKYGLNLTDKEYQEYLQRQADKYFIKAIIVNIDLPEMG